jgi:60 kDa SS-A/Ro ribonucleoprotein
MRKNYTKGKNIMSKLKYANLSGLANNVSTHVSQKIPGTNQELNSDGGGYTYVISEWNLLDRFLILGTESGSYYTSAKEMTSYSCDVLLKLIAEDSNRVVDQIVAVSDKGLAVKNEPAIFALATTVANTVGTSRKYALNALTKVCRTSTHLFLFLESYKSIGGGFGSSVRKAINSWYQEKSIDSLAYQLVKYRQRYGWTHHDVLRLSHPKATSDSQNLCFKFAKACANKIKDFDLENAPSIIEGYLKISKANDKNTVLNLINQYKLPREAVPTKFLNEPEVWEAMLPDMPATALIRNLGTMSSNGLITDLSSTEKIVLDKLSNNEWLRNSRIHPISILIASKVYEKGTGMLGSNVWHVNRRVLDALQDAFYASFDNIEKTDEVYLLGVDISSSMTLHGNVLGINGLSAAEAAIALAMSINKQNERSLIMGFSDRFIDLGITYKDKLNESLRRCYKMGFGSTDCSLPMQYAMQKNLNIDKFIVITDNEVNTGFHPSKELVKYRREFKKNSGMVICATSATRFSIADPKDPKQLDIVGFSPDVPKIISLL